MPTKTPAWHKQCQEKHQPDTNNAKKNTSLTISFNTFMHAASNEISKTWPASCSTKHPKLAWDYPITDIWQWNEKALSITRLGPPGNPDLILVTLPRRTWRPSATSVPSVTLLPELAASPSLGHAAFPGLWSVPGLSPPSPVGDAAAALKRVNIYTVMLTLSAPAVLADASAPRDFLLHRLSVTQQLVWNT